MSMTTFDISADLSESVDKQLSATTTGFITRTVEFLASEYGFNAQEAIQRLGLESVYVNRSGTKKSAKAPKAQKALKEKRIVPSMPLPFCGVVKDDWCCGVRLNHGLYTQCTMQKGKDTEFCKTCTKQIEKNTNNKPTYGVVQDRMSVGIMEYRDHKGKQVVGYGNVMAKLKIGKEAAIAEAAKFGWVIAEDQFEERNVARGRPKKVVSDVEVEKPKKKRGRPKKVKEVVVVTEAMQARSDNSLALSELITWISCPCCPKTYSGRGGLKQHMDMHHPEPGALAKYVCEFCDRAHACRSNLERHKLSCKKNPVSIAAGSVDCKFKCEACGHGFKQKVNMLMHRCSCSPVHLVM